MTDAPSATAATVTTVEHVDPSPLPENNWFWRRVYTFLVTAALLTHIYWLSLRTSDIATLRETIRNDQGLILLYALLYLAGASAEAITRLLAAVRTTRRETVTTAPPPATIATPSATVQTTAAPPAPAATDHDPTMYGGPRP